MRLRDLARNTALVVAGSLVTAAAGLLLRVALARRFGPSGETDAILLAIQAVDGFAVPLSGIVAAVAIPELARLANPDHADAVARRLLRTMATIFCAIAALLWLFAGPIAKWMVGRPDPPAVALTAQALGWLAISVAFYGTTGILVAFAQRQGDYLSPALVLPLRNLGALVGVAALGRAGGVGAAVIGYLIGASAQVTVLLTRVGRRLRPVPPVGWRHPAVGAVQRACAPLVAGAVVVQLNLFLTIRYAAMLGEGRATEFNYGSSIATLAAALIGPSLADASFPTLSAASAAGDRALVRRQLTMVLQSAVTLSAAMSGLLVALATDLVSTLFGGPRFPSDSIARSADVLRVLGLGLAPLVLQTLLGRALYAERDRVGAQALVGAALIVNVACQTLLVPRLGLAGVAASLAIALAASTVAMLVLLVWRYDAIDLAALGASCWRSLWTAVAVWAAITGVLTVLPLAHPIARTLAGGVAGGLALIAALAIGDELQMRGRLLRLVGRLRR